MKCYFMIIFFFLIFAYYEMKGYKRANIHILEFYENITTLTNLKGGITNNLNLGLV